VALWREALLAKAVLGGRTRGYRRHPQLERFRACSVPRSAINAYLLAVFEEASRRGYAFDRSKVGPVRPVTLICGRGQMDYEWAHLMRKLRRRSPRVHKRWSMMRRPEPHPLFRVRRGGIEDWERR